MKSILTVTALAASLFVFAPHATRAQDAFVADPGTDRSRFQPYEPNYVIGQGTEGDDGALEAHYSFKYLFTRPESTDNTSGGDFYFKFTGEFDFYMGTRESGPVINRQSNPAFHYRRYTKDKPIWGIAVLKYFDIGLQHFSNGQATDADRGCDSGTCDTQLIFDRNPNDRFFDSISRGVNYVSVETSFRLGKNRKNKKSSGRCDGSAHCYDLWVRVIPWYITDDNLVTWGPDVNTRHVAEFERVRVILSHRYSFCKPRANFSEIEATLKWTLGDDFVGGDSAELGIFLPWQRGRVKIPLYLQIHDGPLNNLSDYTRSRSSFGLGLRFY